MLGVIVNRTVCISGHRSYRTAHTWHLQFTQFKLCTVTHGPLTPRRLITNDISIRVLLTCMCLLCIIKSKMSSTTAPSISLTQSDTTVAEIHARDRICYPWRWLFKDMLPSREQFIKIGISPLIIVHIFPRCLL